MFMRDSYFPKKLVDFGEDYFPFKDAYEFVIGIGSSEEFKEEKLKNIREVREKYDIFWKKHSFVLKANNSDLLKKINEKIEKLNKNHGANISLKESL
jgi:hypothetical protein